MPIYKCLSVSQPAAYCIAAGEKTIEVRSWTTKYRGQLLICATAEKFVLDGEVFPYGCTICLVDLIDVRPLEKADCAAALMYKKDWRPGLYAWVLANPRRIENIPIKGRQRLYTLELPELEILE